MHASTSIACLFSIYSRKTWKERPGQKSRVPLHSTTASSDQTAPPAARPNDLGGDQDLPGFEQNALTLACSSSSLLCGCLCKFAFPSFRYSIDPIGSAAPWDHSCRRCSRGWNRLEGVAIGDENMVRHYGNCPSCFESFIRRISSLHHHSAALGSLVRIPTMIYRLKPERQSCF